MIRFIIEKLLQKKWMVVSLFAGTLLFISVICLNPIYMHAALENMLVKRMEIEEMKTGIQPMTAAYSEKLDIFEKEYLSVKELSNKKIYDQYDEIKAPILQDVCYYDATERRYTSDFKVEDGNEFYIMGIETVEGLYDQIDIVNGEMPMPYTSGDTTVDCIVTQTAYQKQELSIGEELTFDGVVNPKGEPVKFRVCGVFEKKPDSEKFFIDSQNEFENRCFIEPLAFDEIVGPSYAMRASGSGLFMHAYRVYDYEQLKYENAQSIYESSQEISKGSEVSFIFAPILEKYLVDCVRISRTMLILQVPLIALLALFIYMVAAKMIDMEQNEIAMLKSRGVSGFQVLLVYLSQSIVITIAAAAIGIFLACAFAGFVGMANSFMEFVIRKPLPIKITAQALKWLICAMAFCVFVMTIPVLPKCRATIVEQKRKKRKGKKVFWKRAYIDVIGLLISGYLYYSYHRQLSDIRLKIQSGESTDPVLFLASTLFILSISLFLVRIIPIIVDLIYRIGKKHWSVAAYTAFLQCVRNQERQSFMMLFLITAVAMGIFNADTARTINDNEERNIHYDIGCDIRFSEPFQSNKAIIKYKIEHGTKPIDAPELIYKEPDEFKYREIADDIESMTKVYCNESSDVRSIADFTGNGNNSNGNISLDRGNVTLLGIRTDEFGRTATMPSHVTEKHWYHDLNAMAENPYGVLVSRNIEKQFGAKVGDCISYSNYDLFDRCTGTGKGVIVGFIDYFPGYIAKPLVTNADGTVSQKNHYLVVASFDMMTSTLGSMPYERWIKNKDGNGYIYDFTEKNHIAYESFADAKNEIIKMKNDPMIQETNGLLTIEFLVALLICGVGFLIFQIMSIKERELLFGVYRAMGMTMGEVKGMIVLEQLFSSVPAVIFGVLSGMIAAWAYVPLIEVAYVSDTVKSLPTRIVQEFSDMTQLAVSIICMFVICMMIIMRNIKKLKIAQALKLGEE